MKRIIIFVLLCLPLCGCSWRDAGDLSAVTAGAIAQDDSGGYTLTAELAVPSADSAIPGAQIVAGQANSIAQAIDSAGAGRDAQLYWSHTRVMLLDTGIARSGLETSVRELTASSEVRPSVRLCAVKNARAADVLTTCTSVSGDPVGFSLGDSMDLAVKQSQIPDMPLYRVLDRMQTNGIDPVLPAVSVTDGQAVLSGTALFSDDVLCGWLEEAQTSMLCIMLDAGDTATVYDSDTRYQLTNLSTDISADIHDTPAFTIEIKADVACETDGQASRAAAALRTQCVQTIETLQRAGCDALGLGRAWEQADAESYHNADADAWRTAPVTVHVTLHGTQSAEGGSR